MASTHGRKRLPLPLSLQDGLRERGYREMSNVGESSPWFWRHPKWPALFVSATASNIPGDAYVIARWHDSGRVQRIQVDVLLGRLEAQLREQAGFNTAMGADRG
jgi:hypothetical protein